MPCYRVEQAEHNPDNLQPVPAAPQPDVLPQADLQRGRQVDALRLLGEACSDPRQSEAAQVRTIRLFFIS
jgi:hypothetical protein